MCYKQDQFVYLEPAATEPAWPGLSAVDAVFQAAAVAKESAPVTGVEAKIARDKLPEPIEYARRKVMDCAKAHARMDQNNQNKNKGIRMAAYERYLRKKGESVITKIKPAKDDADAWSMVALDFKKALMTLTDEGYLRMENSKKGAVTFKFIKEYEF